MMNEQMKLRMLIITALFAAIIGVLAQVSIPIPPVPITGQTFAIGLAATILGAKYGTMSVLLYLMIGAIGAPVFAQMSGGFAVFVGPTGGFLFGFIPSAFMIGYILEKTSFQVKQAIFANIVGMFIALFFGTVWLKYGGNLSWSAAFTGGFTPFIFVGLIKALLASWLGILIRKRLIAANLLFTERNISA